MEIKVLFSYLKSKKKVFAMFVLMWLIFSLLVFLYEIPVEVIIYSFVLALIPGGIFFIYSFYRYYQLHMRLIKVRENIVFSTDALPKSSELLQKDYHDLISVLFYEKQKGEQHFSEIYQEMLDYYTLWVHQIKTPISAMRLLLQAEDSERSHELLAELFKVEQYTEMVLCYLRSDSMSSDLEIRRYNLDHVVRQAVKKYAPLFIRKKIKLDYETLNCEVLTDEKWLLFVIEQILSNAIKYTNSGAIRIYMDAKKPYTLVVADTGIGIRNEDLPRVFERGFTGRNGRSDKKSTGIGLYLCKRILTNLSHTITIQSEVGKGTVVKIGMESVRAARE